jgi:predicted small secreted protein
MSSRVNWEQFVAGVHKEFSMRHIYVASAILAFLVLTSCANTVAGMAKDAHATGDAMNSSTKRVLKASSN